MAVAQTNNTSTEQLVLAAQLTVRGVLGPELLTVQLECQDSSLTEEQWELAMQ